MPKGKKWKYIKKTTIIKRIEEKTKKNFVFQYKN